MIAWWISQPPARSEARLSEEQVRFLGRIARKTGNTTLCASIEDAAAKAVCAETEAVIE